MAGARISGPALAAVGAGSVFLYAGITGRSVLAQLRAVVGGKSPSTVPKSNQITATPSSPGSGSGVTSASGVNPAPAPGGSEKSWISSLLAAIGAPDTAANQSSIASWISHETTWNNSPPDGATYTNNPLNTTLANAGSVGAINSVGVQRYDTPANGVNATAATLLGGSYNDILLLLRSGQGLCGHTLQGLSTWSGGGYSSVC